MKKIKGIFRKYYAIWLIGILILGCIILGYFLYKKNNDYTISVENKYNFAFCELIDYVQNVENYLAKSLISSTPENGAETLNNVWKEANLAQVYLSQLPISTNELASTAKFLNQVSDYSYSLSLKNINGQDVTEEDFKNLEELYNYAVKLKNVLNQLYTDMNSGRISWKELTENASVEFAQQVDNLSVSSFSNIDNSFGEYSGLIYDGAYSEHIEKAEKKALLGKEEIDEEKAKEIIKEVVREERIEEIVSNGLIENGNIKAYDFLIKIKDSDENNPLNISISKLGGYIIVMNYNRRINAETIQAEEAKKIGREFLDKVGFANMQPTYYIKQAGAVTINYAYKKEDVTVYADLIKVKIALDNGEVLGLETTGYLNNHSERTFSKPKVSEEKAKKILNKRLEITSSGLAIIPTKWNTEIFCHEFKGTINDTDFLIYINANTGKEENTLVIIETPNGVLTQ